MAALIRPKRARQYNPQKPRTSMTISLNDSQLAEVQAVMLEQGLGKSGAVQWILDNWRRMKAQSRQEEA